jgi:hypothetical protein
LDTEGSKLLLEVIELLGELSLVLVAKFVGFNGDLHSRMEKISQGIRNRDAFESVENDAKSTFPSLEGLSCGWNAQF